MLVNFKVALGLKGERQVDLAMRCQMDPTLLSQIINERREASPELRSKLAAALGVSERWLFTKRAHLMPASRECADKSLSAATA
jgi:transcriptional regulator with XRE-family HTH domain